MASSPQIQWPADVPARVLPQAACQRCRAEMPAAIAAESLAFGLDLGKLPGGCRNLRR